MEEKSARGKKQIDGTFPVAQQVLPFVLLSQRRALFKQNSSL